MALFSRRLIRNADRPSGDGVRDRGSRDCNPQRTARHCGLPGIGGILLILFSVLFSLQGNATNNAANGLTLWTGNGCNGCHGQVAPAFIDPGKPQVNAANAVSVLDSAITNNAGAFMGSFAAMNASDRSDIAAYIGSIATYSASQSTSVNYGGSVVIPLNHIATTTDGSQPSAVINAISTTAGPVGGTLGAYNLVTPSVTYTHTATNCSNGSFSFHGTGLSGATTSTRSVTITVNPPSAPTTAGSTANIAYSLSPINIPLTIGGGPNTGTITVTSGLSPNVGTLTPSGNTITYTASAVTYQPALTFQFRANGPCANSASSTVTINVAGPSAPVVTALPANGTGGQPFSYTISATNVPANYGVSYAVVGTLPTGISFNTATGTFSGTPTQTGMFPVTISATNNAGTDSKPLTLNIALAAPTINSLLTANATSGSPFNYTITAANLPASFNATGLPTGLSVDTTTGVISGTPVVAIGGPVNVMISATNATGTDTKTLVLTVSLNPPTITSTNTASSNVGAAFNFPVVATDFPSSYAATGLPPGLTINPTSGVISGTPTTAGVYPVMLTATNGSGNGTQTLTITIVLLPPTVTSAATASGTLTQPFSYQITNSSTATSYAATGLPPGLTVNTGTGTITGTPTTVGTYNAMVSATNASGTGSLAVTFTIANLPPPSAGGVNLGVPYGTATTVDLGAATGGNYSSVAITVQPLHGKVTLNGLVATYTPNTGYSGPDSFVYTATGVGGTSAPATVNVTVALPGAPKATAKAVTVTFNAATPINLTGSITGVATSIAVVTNPAHGTVTVSGLIATYTPTAGYFGADTFTYTATGPGGTSDAAEVSVTVGTAAPTVSAVRFILPLNTPTTMDLAPFISGSAISGVVVSTAPKYGTAAVNGTKVTYTPNTDFFGDDAFTYAAFGNAGTSGTAVVSVSVVGRPDPSKDAAVAGLVTAQADAANRFARAQIGNFQSRMESLHRSNELAGDAPSPVRNGGKKTATARAETGAEAAPRIVADEATGTQKAGMLRVANGRQASPQNGTAERAVADFPFAREAVSLLTSRSLNVASLAGDTGGGGGAAGTTGVNNFWTAGTASFGTRDANGSRNSLDFTTAGISVGVDRRFSKEWVLGMGMGFARDRTDIGSDGTYSKARGASFVGYGSYQPGRNIYIDGLLGFGSLDFKTQRYVKPIDEFASNDRSGSQLFGSVSGGYEYRDGGLMYSPYLRLDYISDRLKQSSETGAGLYALTYFNQTTPSMQGALGLRAEAVHQTDYGWATPRARIEYRREFQGERLAAIAYADLTGGAQYTVMSGPVARNALMLGFGSDFQNRRGLTIGVDYQLLHTSAGDSSQGLRLTISQDLDGRGSPFLFGGFPLVISKPQEIQFDAGFMYDDNVTRGRISAEKLSDRAYSANVGKGFMFTLNDNARARVTPSVGGEKFTNYRGLNRAIAGVQGQVEYRTSGAFDAPTFAAFAEVAGDYYDSDLRRGYRYQIGASIRQQLTDRIGVFGALAYNGRRAKSEVFTGNNTGIRLNLDYSLTRDDTIYMTGEFRRGQTFASGRPSLDNLDITDVFVLDDAFPNGFFTYRFDADTVISTLGYNMGFGPRHSLDFSWRRAQSTPRQKSAVSSGSSSYIADQYSIVYLIRF